MLKGTAIEKKALEEDIAVHAAIAEACNYKLSVANADLLAEDFSAIAKVLKNRVYFKFENILWLSVLQCIAEKDPALLAPEVRPYSSLPGGHQEAWPDAFRNTMHNILQFVADGRDPATADGILFPTFANGLRVAEIAEALVASSDAGGRWVDVAEN